MKIVSQTLYSAVLLLFFAGEAAADSILDGVTGDLFQWQTNEIHLQYGHYEIPFEAGDSDEEAYIVTLQHADGWKYGDNFFFIDFIEGDVTDDDLYLEFYANFSFEKISGKTVDLGPLTDVGLIFGFNYAREAEVYKYLPGIRFSWDIPGFTFLNTDFMAYIDDSNGVSEGGAPKEDDSFLIDVNWAYPFSVGDHDFSIEGHVEFAQERENEFGDDVESHILAQPQFRYDLGKTIFDKPKLLFVGVEYQVWWNKLGDDNTNEHAVQGLVALRF